MRMEPVTVHIPRDLKRWLEKAAGQLDQTLAAYVRRVLKQHRQQEADTHGRAPEPAAEPAAGES